MTEEELNKPSFKDRIGLYAEKAMEWFGAFLAAVFDMLIRVMSIAALTVSIFMGVTLGLVISAAIIGAIATPFIYLAKFF